MRIHSEHTLQLRREREYESKSRVSSRHATSCPIYSTFVSRKDLSIPLSRPMLCAIPKPCPDRPRPKRARHMATDGTWWDAWQIDVNEQSSCTHRIRTLPPLRMTEQN